MAAGPGFYDAQGVWQYGESTPAGPLFSDYLNLLAATASAAIGADRTRLTALELGHLTRLQLDTTNSNPRMAQQVGRGVIVATAVTSITEAVTFPAAFATPPIVVATFNGVRAMPFDPSGGAASTNQTCYVHSVTTTGFQVVIERTSNMSNGFGYYYAWTAIGTV